MPRRGQVTKAKESSVDSGRPGYIPQTPKRLEFGVPLRWRTIRNTGCLFRNDTVATKPIFMIAEVPCISIGVLYRRLLLTSSNSSVLYCYLLYVLQSTHEHILEVL